MLIKAIADLFIHKIVGSVIIIACWPFLDQKNVMKEFSRHGIRTTISCDPKILRSENDYHLQGVLYINQENNNLLKQVHKKYFSNRFKWLVIGNNVPEELNHARYDSDIIMLRTESANVIESGETILTTLLSPVNGTVYFDDVYVHPKDRAIFYWGSWNTSTGLQITHDRERILRRKNLKKYPLRITAPVAHYSEDTYNGTFVDYLIDGTGPDHGLKCGYSVSSVLIEMLNGTEVIIKTKLWNSLVDNDSMIMMLDSESAELSAGILRIMPVRIQKMDYVIPIWLFNVGFTYLAERESSSNMYVEPFSAGVWWSCLVVGLILAVAQKMTARKVEEKEGAIIGVLATWLQQDASAVPEGISGRWTFTVLSVCSMLVHAYYTSAIVSALMSTGRGGPQSLKALADSRYAIASEDHDFIRVTMFDVETTWDDLEYLKKKKLTSKFYLDIKYGVQLIQQGTTAYHAEYHQLYSYLNILNDDDLCKIQHVDTIPEVMTWVTTSPRGQWTNIFRISGAWLQETGLAKRLVSRLRVKPPPCRSALLAERVTFWDVAPLLAVTVLAALLSLGLLGLEIIIAKWSGQYKTQVRAFDSEASLIYIE